MTLVDCWHGRWPPGVYRTGQCLPSKVRTFSVLYLWDGALCRSFVRDHNKESARSSFESDQLLKYGYLKLEIISVREVPNR